MGQSKKNMSSLNHFKVDCIGRTIQGRQPCPVCLSPCLIEFQGATNANLHYLNAEKIVFANHHPNNILYGPLVESQLPESLIV